ncbi:hypothetical protein KIN20_010011 [Parelaphostrongylus tenuis]|uniref:Uncharacterized protein n=1 Tax=Parelaphostrongylus tenuis TaxID=148309 RepID=A0AAD5QLL0_PARTN|nr:hypothetical protein KIN20_010011 [Parelaphostrongylus tenuis]
MTNTEGEKTINVTSRRSRTPSLRRPLGRASKINNSYMPMHMEDIFTKFRRKISTVPCLPCSEHEANHD